MNHKEIIIFSVFILVILALVYFSSQQQTSGKELAKSLFFKSLEIGKNATSYLYSYEEDSSGFKTTIKLVKNGSLLLVNDSTLLSAKTTYFSDNDTVLCINVKFKSTASCASVKNETSLQPYLASRKGLFVDDKKINDTEARMAFLLEKGALTFSDNVSDKDLGEKKCKEINFLINYSVLSLADAIKAGVMQGMPMEIYGDVCIDADTGQWHEKTFRASYMGNEIVSSSKLLKADWNASGDVVLPLQIANGTEKLVSLFAADYELQNEILTCLDKPKTERDKCIHNNAMWETFPQLCEMAGNKRDECYFDLALINKDKDLCKAAGSFEEDCYLELGWKTKNTTYCGLISNATKKDFCVEKITNATISLPLNTTNNETLNSTG